MVGPVTLLLIDSFILIVYTVQSFKHLLVFVVMVVVVFSFFFGGGGELGFVFSFLLSCLYVVVFGCFHFAFFQRGGGGGVEGHQKQRKVLQSPSYANSGSLTDAALP